MQIKRLLLPLLPLMALLGGAAFGQHGGKAESLRIEFKRGASSATLSNSVRGDEEMEYVFAAREGQRITITLTSKPPRSTHFELKRAEPVETLREGGLNLEIDSDDQTWSGVATATGDYHLNVRRLSHNPGRASFTLKLAIR